MHGPCPEASPRPGYQVGSNPRDSPWTLVLLLRVQTLSQESLLNQALGSAGLNPRDVRT